MSLRSITSHRGTHTTLSTSNAYFLSAPMKSILYLLSSVAISISPPSSPLTSTSTSLTPSSVSSLSSILDECFSMLITSLPTPQTMITESLNTDVIQSLSILAGRVSTNLLPDLVAFFTQSILQPFSQDTPPTSPPFNLSSPIIKLLYIFAVAMATRNTEDNEGDASSRYSLLFSLLFLTNNLASQSFPSHLSPDIQHNFKIAQLHTISLLVPSIAVLISMSSPSFRTPKQYIMLQPHLLRQIRLFWENLVFYGLTAASTPMSHNPLFSSGLLHLIALFSPPLVHLSVFDQTQSSADDHFFPSFPLSESETAAFITSLILVLPSISSLPISSHLHPLHSLSSSQLVFFTALTVLEILRFNASFIFSSPSTVRALHTQMSAHFFCALLEPDNLLQNEHRTEPLEFISSKTNPILLEVIQLLHNPEMSPGSYAFSESSYFAAIIHNSLISPTSFSDTISDAVGETLSFSSIVPYFTDQNLDPTNLAPIIHSFLFNTIIPLFSTSMLALTASNGNFRSVISLHPSHGFESILPGPFPPTRLPFNTSPSCLPSDRFYLSASYLFNGQSSSPLITDSSLSQQVEIINNWNEEWKAIDSLDSQEEQKTISDHRNPSILNTLSRSLCSLALMTISPCSSLATFASSSLSRILSDHPSVVFVPTHFLRFIFTLITHISNSLSSSNGISLPIHLFSSFLVDPSSHRNPLSPYSPIFDFSSVSLFELDDQPFLPSDGDAPSLYTYPNRHKLADRSLQLKYGSRAVEHLSNYFPGTALALPSNFGDTVSLLTNLIRYAEDLITPSISFHVPLILLHSLHSSLSSIRHLIAPILCPGDPTESTHFFSFPIPSQIIVDAFSANGKQQRNSPLQSSSYGATTVEFSAFIEQRSYFTGVLSSISATLKEKSNTNPDSLSSYLLQLVARVKDTAPLCYTKNRHNTVPHAEWEHQFQSIFGLVAAYLSSGPRRTETILISSWMSLLGIGVRLSLPSLTSFCLRSIEWVLTSLYDVDPQLGNFANSSAALIADVHFSFSSVPPQMTQKSSALITTLSTAQDSLLIQTVTSFLQQNSQSQLASLDFFSPTFPSLLINSHRVGHFHLSIPYEAVRLLHWQIIDLALGWFSVSPDRFNPQLSPINNSTNLRMISDDTKHVESYLSLMAHFLSLLKQSPSSLSARPFSTQMTSLLHSLQARSKNAPSNLQFQFMAETSFSPIPPLNFHPTGSRQSVQDSPQMTNSSGTPMLVEYGLEHNPNLPSSISRRMGTPTFPPLSRNDTAISGSPINSISQPPPVQTPSFASRAPPDQIGPHFDQGIQFGGMTSTLSNAHSLLNSIHSPLSLTSSTATLREPLSFFSWPSAIGQKGCTSKTVSGETSPTTENDPSFASLLNRQQIPLLNNTTQFLSQTSSLNSNLYAASLTQKAIESVEHLFPTRQLVEDESCPDNLTRFIPPPSHSPLQFARRSTPKTTFPTSHSHSSSLFSSKSPSILSTTSTEDAQYSPENVDSSGFFSQSLLSTYLNSKSSISHTNFISPLFTPTKPLDNACHGERSTCHVVSSLIVLAHDQSHLASNDQPEPDGQAEDIKERGKQLESDKEPDLYHPEGSPFLFDRSFSPNFHFSSPPLFMSVLPDDPPLLRQTSIIVKPGIRLMTSFLRQTRPISFSQRWKLVQTLVRSEIERTLAWHDPLSSGLSRHFRKCFVDGEVPPGSVPFIPIKTNWATFFKTKNVGDDPFVISALYLLGINAAHYHSDLKSNINVPLILIAWGVNPQLAVNMFKRVKHNGYDVFLQIVAAHDPVSLSMSYLENSSPSHVTKHPSQLTLLNQRKCQSGKNVVRLFKPTSVETTHSFTSQTPFHSSITTPLSLTLPFIHMLYFFSPMPIEHVLAYLSPTTHPTLKFNPALQSFVVYSLNNTSKKRLLFFIPQLVQTFRLQADLSYINPKQESFLESFYIHPTPPKPNTFIEQQLSSKQHYGVYSTKNSTFMFAFPSTQFTSNDRVRQKHLKSKTGERRESRSGTKEAIHTQNQHDFFVVSQMGVAHGSSLAIVPEQQPIFTVSPLEDFLEQPIDLTAAVEDTSASSFSNNPFSSCPQSVSRALLASDTFTLPPVSPFSLLQFLSESGHTLTMLIEHCMASDILTHRLLWELSSQLPEIESENSSLISAAVEEGKRISTLSDPTLSSEMVLLSDTVAFPRDDNSPESTSAEKPEEEPQASTQAQMSKKERKQNEKILPLANVLFLQRVSILIRLIQSSLSTSSFNALKSLFSFYGGITAISGVLKPFLPQKRKEVASAHLASFGPNLLQNANIYSPTAPEKRIVSVDYSSIAVMKSHAKCPMRVSFETETVKPQLISSESPFDPPETPVAQQNLTTETQRSTCIFKSGDDCRQDSLALQIIALMAEVFNDTGADVFLAPYQVIPVSGGKGIIEVVPHSKSRDMIGTLLDGNLAEFFAMKYAEQQSKDENGKSIVDTDQYQTALASSIPFRQAQRNYIRSAAGYSLVVYLLNIRDRHNGNILIDEAGHLIHIDFGFMFNIAPGGIQFERAPFKLNQEMMDLISAGNRDTRSYGTTDMTIDNKQDKKEKQSNQQKRKDMTVFISPLVIKESPTMQPDNQRYPKKEGATRDSSDGFHWFVTLCARGFLALRDSLDTIIPPIESMMVSHLDCFRPTSIIDLLNRLDPLDGEFDAIEFIKHVIDDSKGAFSTGVYDTFQYLTNKITF
ncbi:putative Phosphatidylinositol 4-kinase stt4 [Blattamonas nauphoetae]|uniref:1-phosphatidylinositol 4-kinase n=1 Tax=Blattamonas nauphoetae TaxID=2049346 RepID=A0ABQ9YHI0_9EUKA|nr:putative Phosphatidylinositol 4-kinase stt4 [Blattamonas nauphoetae]